MVLTHLNVLVHGEEGAVGHDRDGARQTESEVPRPDVSRGARRRLPGQLAQLVSVHLKKPIVADLLRKLDTA